MDSEVASRKIFIGGLSYGTDDEKLRQYFEAFGTVQDAVVMKDPVSRRSRGFGFITFEHSSYVDNVLAQDVHTIDSRKVEAKRAVPRNEVSRDPPPMKPPVPSPVIVSVNSPATGSVASGNSDDYAFCKIFVGGLHYDTRDGEFRKYFEKYGRVLSAEVMFNRETHKSRGFGFIVFENESGVDCVCAEREHIIDGKLVEVKRAVPRSKISGTGGSLKNAASTQSHTTKPVTSTTPQKSNVARSSSGGVDPTAHASQSSQKPPITPSRPSSKATPSKASPAAPQPSPAHVPTPTTRRANVATASYAAALKSGAGKSGAAFASATSSGGVALSSRNTLSSPSQGSHSSEYDGSSSPQQSQMLPTAQPALLQHQEQFPLPSGPVGDRIISPNSRLRAHSESFVNMVQKGNSTQPAQVMQQQQLQQSVLQPPHINFLSGDVNGHSQQHQQQQQRNPAHFFDGFGIPFQYQGQQRQQSRQQQDQEGAFGMLSSSGGSSMNSDAMSWNPDQVYRTDIERSTSLGGLGWMPSSIATSPPETRRVVSDLGMGQMSFGMHGHGDIPSPSAWASMVDIGGQGQYSQQQGQGGVPFGSPDISSGRKGSFGGSSSNDYDYGSGQQDLSNASLGNDEDDGYILSDLRLQACEFVPSSANMSAWGGGGGSM